MLLLLSDIFLSSPIQLLTLPDRGKLQLSTFVYKAVRCCQMLSVHAYTCGGKNLADQQVSPEANVSRFPFIFFNLSGFSTLLVTTCLLKGLFI